MFSINNPYDGTDTYNYPPAVFDGTTNQRGIWTTQGGNFTWDYASGIVVNEKIEIYTSLYNAVANFTVDTGTGPVSATLSNNSSGWGWRTIENVTGTLTQFTATATRKRWLRNGSCRVDGRILLDGPPEITGPYSILYQTWSQWVVQTLRQGLAEADALRSMLKSHAQTYSAGSDYCEGSVIKAFGELWIAISDAPATTFADLPAIKTHPNWEQLNISIN